MTATSTTAGASNRRADRLLEAVRDGRTVVLHQSGETETYELVIELLDGNPHLVRHGKFSKQTPYVYPRGMSDAEFSRRVASAVDYDVI